MRTWIIDGSSGLRIIFFCAVYMKGGESGENFQYSLLFIKKKLAENCAGKDRKNGVPSDVAIRNTTGETNRTGLRGKLTGN